VLLSSGRFTWWRRSLRCVAAVEAYVGRCVLLSSGRFTWWRRSLRRIAAIEARVGRRFLLSGRRFTRRRWRQRVAALRVTRRRQLSLHTALTSCLRIRLLLLLLTCLCRLLARRRR